MMSYENQLDQPMVKNQQGQIRANDWSRSWKPTKPTTGPKIQYMHEYALVRSCAHAKMCQDVPIGIVSLAFGA